MTEFHTAHIDRATHQSWTGGDFETDNPQVAALQIAEAQAHGLTHVLDARDERDDSSFLNSHAPGQRYTWMGIGHAGQIVHDDRWANATTVVRRALKEPEEKVLVHGHMGVNLGPSLAFATLLTQG